MYYHYKKIILSLIIFTCTLNITAQNYLVYGEIKDSSSQKAIDGAEVFSTSGNLLAKSNKKGVFKFISKDNNIDIVIFTTKYKVYQKKLSINDSIFLKINLSPIAIELSEVQINEKKIQSFALGKLNDVEGTSIYAGKKTEVVLIDNSAALAINNARQIYKQVAGLNIYQNDDAGLQLNVGGRGLNPNRTANFNTRQNGYDISADVLGYPESYYTPPSEALEKVEIIRGAASLQYGTQFGGLINFILKSPTNTQKNKYVIRNTTGSFGLYSNFSSVDGTYKKLQYYSFINYKKGDGFRPNSNFNSISSHLHLKKVINNKLSTSLELTYLNYLAQQAGGMNDEMFENNPFQSNRSRNWFKVNWLIYNVKLNYKRSDSTEHALSIFGLSADRYAIGYRSNRVFQVDPMLERDLIHGEFENYGFEYKRLKSFKNGKNHNLIGLKFYKSNNTSRQGPGSNSSDNDFKFYNSEYPNYQNQSFYVYPNINIALFTENIFYINNKLSITPGIRYENIKTISDGSYKFSLLDGAGNAITDTTYENYSKNERAFILMGLGLSYKMTKQIELYINLSQNYRSVTFADISIINPAYIVSAEINDESGNTSDIGVRGNVKNRFSYDINLFQLLYKKRIGFVLKEQNDGNVKSERGNIGDAKILGIESLLDYNIITVFEKKLKVNYFINTAIMKSEYISSDLNSVLGKEVEFVPKINFKTGFYLTYNNLGFNTQYSYMSQQFTDASNSIESNLSGVIGQIPKYKILDVNLSYTSKNYKVECGINNALNEIYFTRRATGYPGPGIIPSPPRNYYITLQLNL